MNTNKRLSLLLVAVILVFGFSQGMALTVANAAPDPYLHLHTFNLVCQSGGTEIAHLVQYDMFLPQGYYRNYSNSGGSNFTLGPYGTDITEVNSGWNGMVSASPYNEQSFIYDAADNPVYEAGYEADCVGVTDGDQANLTYWSHPIGGGSGLPASVVPVPGPDMVTIPDYAVVGQFTQSTPAYFLPSLDAASSVMIDAGKTLWIFGMDESGQFYQVVLSGKFFWVPVNTVGPNFDGVWYGMPLPTNIVE